MKSLSVNYEQHSAFAKTTRNQTELLKASPGSALNQIQQENPLGQVII